MSAFFASQLRCSLSLTAAGQASPAEPDSPAIALPSPLPPHTLHGRHQLDAARLLHAKSASPQIYNVSGQISFAHVIVHPSGQRSLFQFCLACSADIALTQQRP